MDYSKLVAELIQRVPEGENAAIWVAEQLKNAEFVANRIRAIRNQMQEVKSSSEQQLEKLVVEVGKVGRTCRHQSTTFHRDAAGGSGSWTECDICGIAL